MPAKPQSVLAVQTLARTEDNALPTFLINISVNVHPVSLAATVKPLPVSVN